MKKNSDNAIYAYYQAIKSGQETVGKWIQVLYSILVHGIESGKFIFDQAKANRAIKFIENFMRHNKGPLAPQKLKLSLWQKAAISAIFGIVDEDGRRHFREVFWVVGRKCGKTLLAAGIMEYMAYADGEFGGEIYCLAPKLEQSDLVYSAFEFSVRKSSSLESRTEWRGRKGDIFIAESNTTIKKIAFNEKMADGFNPHLTVGDEMAAWKGARGLKMYEVMVSGTGAREQPLTLAISSSGYENEGIYDELMKRATSMLNGSSREKRLLPIIYMIDDVREWDNINELKKSLPGLGVSISVDFVLDQINIAYQSLSKRAEFLTKYCNIKQNSSQAWLKDEDVRKACGDPLKLEDFRGTYCVGGIDLSKTTDLTACVAIIERDGVLNVFAKFFLPTEKLEEATIRDGLPYDTYIKRGFLQLSGENFIDYRDCMNWYVSLVRDYQILPLQIGYDRYCATYLTQEMQQLGFHMDDCYQGFNMTPAIRTFEGMLKDKKINIGDNDLLKVHLLDSALKVDNEAEKCKLVKLRKYAHVDGTAAILDAIIVRDKWSGEIGEPLKNIKEDNANESDT